MGHLYDLVCAELLFAVPPVSVKGSTLWFVDAVVQASHFGAHDEGCGIGGIVAEKYRGLPGVILFRKFRVDYAFFW